MSESYDFNLQQRCAISHMKSDLRFIYTTIIVNQKSIQSNYAPMLMPYIGLIVDGVEDWIRAYNNSHTVKIEAPVFTNEEQEYYEEMRASIKIWENSFSSVYSQLEGLYIKSDEYFASLCKPVARVFHLYDIFGADVANGKFCGNTILCSYYVPQFNYGIEDGKRISRMSEVGGKYISFFDATKEYQVDKTIMFFPRNYGGFVKSPVGNRFSDRFILFSLLCQINFVLICVEAYILDECPTKLRFEYLQYYYMSKIISEIYEKTHVNLELNAEWISAEFRNAMSHYKVGVALNPNEIIIEDPFCGLTQKYLHTDYYTLKHLILCELRSLSTQIERYLHLK